MTEPHGAGAYRVAVDPVTGVLRAELQSAAPASHTAEGRAARRGDLVEQQQPREAVAAWRTALTILEGLRHVDTAQVRRRLEEMATEER